MRVRWYLLRKEPVPESRNKTFAQQTALLTKEEDVPMACVVTYTVILHWLAHRERLLQDAYVRCRDKASGDRRVFVDRFTSDGFDVYAYPDGRRIDCVGLASARKCP